MSGYIKFCFITVLLSQVVTSWAQEEGDPEFYYYLFTQEYSQSKFSVIAGEIIHIDNSRGQSKYLSPGNPQYISRETKSELTGEGIWNLDSLGKTTHTEEFIAHKGDSVSLFFSSTISTTSGDTVRWYNFLDTMKVSIDVVESSSERIIQVLDSTVMLPFNRTRDLNGRYPRHEMFLAQRNQNGSTFCYSYALNIPDDSMKVRIHVRPYFGASATDHKANVTMKFLNSSRKISEEMLRRSKKKELEVDDTMTRIYALLARHSENLDPSLTTQVEIANVISSADTTYTLSFTSTQGQEYDIHIEDESGESMHHFDPVYAFPGMEQELSCDTRAYPTGYYIVLISSKDTLVNVAIFVVRRMGESLLPSASPIREEFRKRGRR